MTTIEISLPDGLAKEAAKAGLLSGDALTEMFRARLAEKKVAGLQEARMTLRGNPIPTMSAAELRAEIAAVRARPNG
jgi:hypothetical protein